MTGRLRAPFVFAARVIRVPVRNEDEVDFAQRGKVLVLERCPRVLSQERVDDDDLARRARDSEGRMAEPQNLNLLLRCRETCIQTEHRGHAGRGHGPGADCDGHDCLRESCLRESDIAMVLLALTSGEQAGLEWVVEPLRLEEGAP
jgi:hypothetical protein